MSNGETVEGLGPDSTPPEGSVVSEPEASLDKGMKVQSFKTGMKQGRNWSEQCKTEKCGTIVTCGRCQP